VVSPSRGGARATRLAALSALSTLPSHALSDVRYERENALTDTPVDVAIGRLEPGTVAALKMTFVGVVDSHDFLANSWVWRMSDDVAPEWPTGDQWILEIDGDPQVRSAFDLSTGFDAKRPVSLTVANLNVNAIAALCQATPGVKTNLTLPVIAGGYPAWRAGAVLSGPERQRRLLIVGQLPLGERNQVTKQKVRCRPVAAGRLRPALAARSSAPSRPRCGAATHRWPR
jgi:hypothetical protein